MTSKTGIHQGRGNTAGIDFTPNWDLVIEGPDWFGKNERQLRQLADETAGQLAGKTVQRINAAKGKLTVPCTENLRQAEELLNPEIGALVVSDPWIHAFQSLNGPAASNLRFQLERLLPPFELPLPAVAKQEIKPVAAALFAAVGAVLGMVLVSGLCRLAFGTQFEGVLIGAGLGAFLFTWGMVYVAGNETLQRWIITALGVASITEAAILAVKSWFIPSSWFTNTRGHVGAIKRIFVYLALIVLVFVTRRNDEFNIDQYRKEVQMRIRHHLHFALSLIAVLSQIVLRLDEKKAAMVSDEGKTLRKIAETAREFCRADSVREIGDTLDVLLQELRNGGFDITKPNSSLFDSDIPSASSPVSLPQVVVWNEEMKDRYESFGHIDEGTPVAIMEEPLIQNGVVLKKGQVKFSRKGK